VRDTEANATGSRLFFNLIAGRRTRSAVLVNVGSVICGRRKVRGRWVGRPPLLGGVGTPYSPGLLRPTGPRKKTRAISAGNPGRPVGLGDGASTSVVRFQRVYGELGTTGAVGTLTLDSIPRGDTDNTESVSTELSREESFAIRGKGNGEAHATLQFSENRIRERASQRSSRRRGSNRVGAGRKRERKALQGAQERGTGNTES